MPNISSERPFWLLQIVGEAAPRGNRIYNPNVKLNTLTIDIFSIY